MGQHPVLLRMAPLLRPRVAKAGAGLAVVLAATGLLAACSVEGTLMPTADVDSVGSITPPAPVGGGSFGYGETAAAMPQRQALPQPVYQPSSVPVSGAASAVEEQPLPSVDPMVSSPAAQSGDPAGLMPSTQVASAAPAGVVDVDSVAEGVTDQPVVTGIGTDNPVEYDGRSRANRTALPGGEAATEIYGGPRQLGAPPQPLSLPAGAAETRETAPPLGAPVRVAAMPRMPDPVAPAPEPMIVDPAPAPAAPAPAPQSTWNGGTGMPASEVACRQELKRLGVGYTDIPRISGGRSCGIDWPIKLTSLSGDIRIKPAATLNCQVTAEFAKWVKSDMAPAARARYLSGIKSITQLSSYSCRTMNSQRGAPMSEHAHGNAIDIGAITLNSGRKIDVRKPGWFAFRKRGFLNTVRAESCDNFTTVLGPGSNKYHWNHFHFDLRQRKSGKSYCDL